MEEDQDVDSQRNDRSAGKPKSIRDKLINEYGLESLDVDDEGDAVDGKGLLQICLTNARLVAKDGVPACLPRFPRLSIGSLGSAYNLESLQAIGITHIVCASGVVRMKYPDRFVYHRVDIRDKSETDIASHWQSCWDFIDAALEITSENGRENKVLIHCYQGISRSTTILASYLMKRFGLSMVEALDEIRSVRPVAAPNPGFLMQLRALERSLTCVNSNGTVTTEG
eukprot:gene31465-40512_t